MQKNRKHSANKRQMQFIEGLSRVIRKITEYNPLSQFDLNSGHYYNNLALI